MTYRFSRRGRLVAAVAFSTLLLFAFAAALARADGEEDPSFGTGGTAFSPLGNGEVSSGPFVRQAPDGTIWVAAEVSMPGRGFGGDIRVVHLDATGKPIGLGGDGVADLSVDFSYALLDFRVLSDGDLALVGRGQASSSRGGQAELITHRFNPDGTPDGGGEGYVRPETCIDGESSSPYVAAAVIDGAGRAVAAWNNCAFPQQSPQQRLIIIGPGATRSMVVRYPDEDTADAPAEFDSITHLDVGPGNAIFALGHENADEGVERGISGNSLVARFVSDATGIAYDPTYGDHVLSGGPVDLAVDGSGRALAWTDPEVFLRGGDPGLWEISRLTASNGVLDDDWGEGGTVTLEDERIGPAVWFESQQSSWLTPQADGKVIALGLSDYPPGTRGSSDFDTERVLVRFTQGGDLDESWGEGGFKTLALAQPTDEDAWFETVQGPSLQGDGKLLVPFETVRPDRRVRVPVPPDGRSLGVTRIGLTPAGEQPPPQQQQQQSSGPPPVVTTTSSQQSRPATCRSRRKFTIRLRTGRRKAERSPIVSAVVRVNGKRVKVTRRNRRTASVNLTNLPRGRFTVSIRLRLKDGGTVRETRRYRTCTKKVERQLGPLRTRKPKSKRR